MQTDENPATIYSIYRDTEATYVVFVTKNGIIKKTALEEYMKTKKKSGLSAINLREDDTLTSVSLIKDETLVLVTAQGLTIHFNSMDVAPTSRTAVGSKGIDLKPDDHVVAALPVRNKSDNLAIFMKNGLGKKMNLSDFPVQKRGGKGLLCTKISDSTGLVAGAALVSDEDNLLVAGTPSSICISATDIPLTGRPAIGNQIVKGSKISSVSKI
jgi:DNA gyrase subunit A